MGYPGASIEPKLVTDVGYRRTVEQRAETLLADISDVEALVIDRAARLHPAVDGDAKLVALKEQAAAPHLRRFVAFDRQCFAVVVAMHTSRNHADAGALEQPLQSGDCILPRHRFKPLHLSVAGNDRASGELEIGPALARPRGKRTHIGDHAIEVRPAQLLERCLVAITVERDYQALDDRDVEDRLGPAAIQQRPVGVLNDACVARDFGAVEDGETFVERGCASGSPKWKNQTLLIDGCRSSSPAK